MICKTLFAMTRCCSAINPFGQLVSNINKDRAAPTHIIRRLVFDRYRLDSRIIIKKIEDRNEP